MKLEPSGDYVSKSMLLEMGDCGSVIQAEDMLLQPSSDGFSQMMLSNISGNS